MADPTASSDTIDTRADLGTGDAALYSFWMGQEQIAEKEENKWTRRGRKIVRRYRDERANNGVNAARHTFNILWSNVQTLIPTLYARTPKPDVQRRFNDQDDTGRLASILLERALSYSLDNFAFDDVMLACVQDRLLPGRGVARVLYVPHFGDEIEEDEAADGDAEFDEVEAEGTNVDGRGDEPSQERPREVTYEEVLASYVFWEDYREAPARSWKEVAWVRYQSYMTRDELIARFGRKKGKQVNLDFTPKGTTTREDKDAAPPDIFKKARIFEFWDKTKMQVVWLAPGTPDLILDEADDPLQLTDFFPSPDPLVATTTTDTRVPVPDYTEYQDQADELDTLTGRIDVLTRALKVSGVYPGANKQELQQLFDEGTENLLIPVQDWAHFSDKGGLDNMIQWVPIKQIADTLLQLYEARDRTKSILYEITGIGDILRGETTPNETATAQQLKANFSTRRIVPQQRQVARFARDIIRLMASVIATHFEAETISQITGYPQLDPVPPMPPMPPQFIPGMTQPQPGTAGAPGSPQPELPPEAMPHLGEQHVTTFNNGQRWTLHRGQPRRVH